VEEGGRVATATSALPKNLDWMDTVPEGSNGCGKYFKHFIIAERMSDKISKIERLNCNARLRDMLYDISFKALIMLIKFLRCHSSCDILICLYFAKRLAGFCVKNIKVENKMY